MNDTNYKGYKNWNYFDDILDFNDHDTTNNGSESVNSRLNRRILAGKKSFKKVCKVIYANKGGYLGEYEARVVRNRLRQRPPALRKRMDKRYDIMQEYSTLSIDDQLTDYLPFLRSIQKWI